MLTTYAKGFLWRAAPESLRHKYRSWADPEYRELHRLRQLPRYTRSTTNLLGAPLVFTDAASFLSMYENIIKRGMYNFRAANPSPLIIDGGANIGLSIIYFKQLYPTCSILGFEPDPALFEVLSLNCNRFGLNGIHVFPEALWNSAGNVSFHHEGADAGRVITTSGENRSFSVPSVRLRDLLDREIDLLKLDVEGSETCILEDCHDRLRYVRHIFVEYHSYRSGPQQPSRLLRVLENAGFRLHIQSDPYVAEPFVTEPVSAQFDFLLEIWGRRQ